MLQRQDMVSQTLVFIKLGFSFPSPHTPSTHSPRSRARQWRRRLLLLLPLLLPLLPLRARALGVATGRARCRWRGHNNVHWHKAATTLVLQARSQPESLNIELEVSSNFYLGNLSSMAARAHKYAMIQGSRFYYSPTTTDPKSRARQQNKANQRQFSRRRCRNEPPHV
jgi:hypothetical protein